MEEQRFTKKDWSLFRSKVAGWQESYMERLNQEYVELLRSDAVPSEKFWELDKRIRADKRSAGVRLEMTRSRLIYNIICLINDGVISLEDLDEFSDTLKETILFCIGRSGETAED